MSSMPLSQQAIIALMWRQGDPVKWTALCMALKDRFPGITEMQVVQKLDMLMYSGASGYNAWRNTGASTYTSAR